MLGSSTNSNSARSSAHYYHWLSVQCCCLRPNRRCVQCSGRALIRWQELVLWVHLEVALPGVPPLELRWPADGPLEQCIQPICSLHGWPDPPTRVRAIYDFRGTLLYPCSLRGADAVAGMVFKHNQTVVASAWAPNLHHNLPRQDRALNSLLLLD